MQIIIEMKHVPINMDCCLRQFDAFSWYGEGGNMGSLYLNLIFFNVNSQILQRNRKIYCSNNLDKNFHNISDISLRVIKLWIITNASF